MKKSLRTTIWILGILSVLYLFSFWMHADSVYSYRSIPLRFKDGDVKIKAKEGYIAYEGHVKGGYANGYGRLYTKDGTLAYEGDFVENRYEGNGILYYPSGAIQYKGTFLDNSFEGEGIFYSESGVKLYEGSFVNGLKEGNGTLFNEAGKLIYEGSFHMDEPVLEQFLTEDATEIAAVYQGEQDVKEFDDSWIVILDELKAAYEGTLDENVTDAVKAETLYVCKEQFVMGANKATTLSELIRFMGEPLSEGKTTLLRQEAYVAEHFGNSEADTCQATVFYKDGITYTFLSRQDADTFFMYTMTKDVK